MAKFTNVQKYMDQLNFFRVNFEQKPPYTINSLNDEVANTLFHSLDGDLSPENLHCDGEISAAQARSKYRFFHKVINELTTAGYTPVGDIYCFQV